VSKLLDKPIEKEDGIDISETTELGGVSIKAEHLSFSFNEGGKRVLQDLNFEIKAGEKVAIFGSQGSGKSTLLRLFTGGYLNFEGNLLFNNYPLGNYHLEKLRAEIGVYLGTADIFSGTLLENLTMGDTHITTAHILETASYTGLLTFIQSLHAGLNTSIDTLGKRLPRSTVNKILLTRALLNKPKLLLLEDFWSDLEQEEQARVIQNLFSMAKESTMISVTNDIQFAAKCDKIILLEEGRILQADTFEEISTNPNYRNLFKNFSL
jgi:ABC-type bacteriocin/lantibiotic exporter with double-glycine peptidase domain